MINYSSITGARNDTIGDNGLQNFQSSPGTMYGICPLNSAPANIYGTGQSLGKAFFDAFINQAGILQDSADPFPKTNNSTTNTITRLLIAPDNTILAVAIHYDFVTNWYLINYLPNGTRNPSFGTNGVGDVVYIASCNDLAIDSDNNIFVTGSSGNFSSEELLVIAKYLPTGTFDTAFGNAGVAYNNSLGQSRGYGIALNNINGSILVVGQITVDGQHVPAFVLYNREGNLVTRFGIQGVQTFSQYGEGVLYSVLVNSRLQATGVGGINNRGSNDSIATILQIGQGSNVIEQIQTGF